MKKCKECGRDEWGFLSVLNEDGYCPTCAIVHNEEKINELQEQIDDLMGCLMAIRDRGCEKDFDCVLSADITLQKWGVK